MIHNLARGQRVFTSNVFLVPGERTALVDVGAEFDVVAAVRDTLDSEPSADSADSRDSTASIDTVVLTHTHHDHVGNLDDVLEAFDPEVRAFDESVPGVDTRLADRETVQLGDHEYVAVHTPGHKPDHLCLYSDARDVLFAGDLVFANGGFGRTDLEEGDRATLVESIRTLLDVLDSDLQAMYTGHGPSVEMNPINAIELAIQTATVR